MKRIFAFAILLLIFSCKDDAKKQVVDVSCGQCMFEMNSEEGCALAVRIDGKTYFVDGADIDDFGDAHDEETGFCYAVRKAEVTGELVDNRFKVTSMKLLDD